MVNVSSVMGITVEQQQRIAKYVKEHPEVKLAPKEVLIEALFEAGIIQTIDVIEYNMLFNTGGSTNPQKNISNNDSVFGWGRNEDNSVLGWYGNTTTNKQDIQVPFKEAGETFLPRTKTPFDYPNYIFQNMVESADNNYDNILENMTLSSDIAVFFFAKLLSEKRDIEADLEKVKETLGELKKAALKGENAYKAKFKELFGVEYNKENVEKYVKKQETYATASIAHTLEVNFKQKNQTLIGNPEPPKKFSEDVDVEDVNSIKNATFEIDTEFTQKLINDFADSLFGGKEQLAEMLKEAHLENASLEEQYKFVHNKAIKMADEMHKNTLEAGGDKEFDEVAKDYDKAIKAAFGESEISSLTKKISDYNTKLQTYAGYVRGAAIAGVVIGLGAATGGFGATALMAEGLGGVATLGASAATGAATFAVTALDEATKKSDEKINWSNIAKASITNGAIVLAFAGATYPVQAITSAAGASIGVQTIASSLASIGTGMVMEKAFTGKITVEGTVFIVLLTLTGAGLQVAKVVKAMGASQAEQAAKVADARQALNIPDDVTLTQEVIKQAYRNMAQVTHPDHAGGSVEAFEQIALAREVLTYALQGNTVGVAGKAPQSQAAQPATTGAADVSSQALVVTEQGGTQVSTVTPAAKAPVELGAIKITKNMPIESIRQLAQTTEGLNALVEKGIVKITNNVATNGTQHTVVTTNSGEIVKSSLIVTRPNGLQVDILDGIPQEKLQSPIEIHLHQVQATTVSDNVGITLTQNASSPVTAKAIPLQGTLEDVLVENNNFGIALKYDNVENTPYQNTPWEPGRQNISGKAFQVTYGEIEDGWGALDSYMAEFKDPVTGKAPDIGTLAAQGGQKGTTDISFMPADIAGKQYDIIDPETGARRPCNYDDVQPGQTLIISKRPGVKLKMVVLDEPSVSLENENLPANKLLMVDSEGHPYNGNPVKRLRSGEVDMSFDETNPTQAKIKQTLDQIKDLDAQTKAAKKAGNKDLANQLKAQADNLAKDLDTQLTDFVKANQNPNNSPQTKSTSLSAAQKQAYEAPNAEVENVVVEQDIMAAGSNEGQSLSIAERASLKYKNTVLNPKAKASVEVLQDRYYCDIEILPNGKANIGGQIFDVGDLSKSEVAEVVRSTFDSSYKPSSASLSAKQQKSPEVVALRSAIKEAYGTGYQAAKTIIKQNLSGDSDSSLLAGWERVSENSATGKAISELLVERGYVYNKQGTGGWETAQTYLKNQGVEITGTEDVSAKDYSFTKYSWKLNGIKQEPITVLDDSVIPAEGQFAQEVSKVVEETNIAKNQKLKTDLLSAETPVNYDKTYFEQWSQENGLTLSYESDGKIAIFKDNAGNVVRRITEDYNNPGKVYDDRIHYFENGKQVAGKTKFADEESPKYYDVEDGYDTNIALKHGDGLWYNRSGRLLDKNPITGEPQQAAQKPVTQLTDEELIQEYYNHANDDFRLFSDEKYGARHDQLVTELGHRGYALQSGGTIVKRGAANTPATVSTPQAISRPCKIPSTMPSQKAQMQNVTVTVAGGDMTAIKADAYVVPEFPDCASEGGVGGAIARGGASGGLKAYDQHVHQNGGLNWGDVVVTESGGGKSTHLIHAVTAGANADNQFSAVQTATYNALKAAQEQGLQSVVVPAMGTGVIGNLTDEQSAQAVLAGINQFAAEGGQMDVSVVVFSTGQGLADFRNTLTSKSYETATPVVGTKEFDMGAWAVEFAQTQYEAPVTSSDAPTAKVVTTPQQAAAKDTRAFKTLTKDEFQTHINNLKSEGFVISDEAAELAELNRTATFSKDYSKPISTIKEVTAEVESKGYDYFEDGVPIKLSEQPPKVLVKIIDKYPNSAIAEMARQELAARSTKASVAQKPVQKPLTKASLLSAEMPVNYNKVYFEQWAQENGLTLSYERDGKIAIFKDQNGNEIRRITENDYTPGKVYDDRIRYYENNVEKAKIIKYGDEKYPRVYTFDDPYDNVATAVAILREDGLWYDYRGSGQLLAENPITGEPQ